MKGGAAVADGNELLTGGGGLLGGAGAVWFGKLLFDRFVKKAAENEEKIEKAKAEREAKVLDALKRIEDKQESMDAQLSDVRHELKSGAARAANIEGRLDGLQERIDGISKHHGPKLDAIMQDMARTDERLKALEAKRR